MTIYLTVCNVCQKWSAIRYNQELTDKIHADLTLETPDNKLQSNIVAVFRSFWNDKIKGRPISARFFLDSLTEAGVFRDIAKNLTNGEQSSFYNLLMPSLRYCKEPVYGTNLDAHEPETLIITTDNLCLLSLDSIRYAVQQAPSNFQTITMPSSPRIMLQITTFEMKQILEKKT